MHVKLLGIALAVLLAAETAWTGCVQASPIVTAIHLPSAAIPVAGAEGMRPMDPARSRGAEATRGAEAGRGAEASTSRPSLESSRPPSSPTPQGPKTVEQVGNDLKRMNGNRNSITVSRGDGVATRYDVSGATHFEKATQKNVPTPHVVEERIKPNPLPDGRIRYGTEKGPVQPATQSDLRTARRVLINRQAQASNQGNAK